ncbi:MAG: hypothetical protein ACRD0G_08020 [Acidimicrobiales bacterium]
MAGPRVVPDHVDAIRRFAAATRVGVLNTWGAKGLFRWDSPFHLGTAGLQERDFELAGVGEADVVLAVGIDEDESPIASLGPNVELVEPEGLDDWVAPLRQAQPPERSRLYSELAAVVGPLYETEGSPAWAAKCLAETLPPGGLVCADPGPVGFWLARTFPTVEPGSVYVPSRKGAGQAARRAAEAAASGRQVVVVADDDWDIDPAYTRALVEVAGPVVAWTRDRRSRV